MCSLQDAWGVPSFQGLPVESQADDRQQYMKPSDELLNPNNHNNMLSKNIPNKNNFTRGIHSRNSPQKRVLPRQKSNDHINVVSDSEFHPETNNMYRPDYMEVYDNKRRPSNVPRPIETNDIYSYMDSTLDNSSDSNNGFTHYNDSFQVSNTVDKFMNMGMDMSGDHGNAELPNNVKYDNSDNAHYNNYVHQNVGHGHNMRPQGQQNPNNKKLTINSEDLKCKLEDDEKIVKMLEHILSRIDNIEYNMKTHQKKNMSDIILYFIITLIIISILFMSLYNKK